MNIIGGEALSRWNHAQRGLLEPKRYVPTLEKEGLISVLDYWTLEQVCAFLQDLRKNGIEWFSVSCNFSRVTFSEAAFIRRCMSIMEHHPDRRRADLQEHGGVEKERN